MKQVSLENKIVWFLYPLPLLCLLTAWYFYTVDSKEHQFIFSSPAQVWQTFLRLSASGELLSNAAVTVFEAAIGFILGTVSGACLGLSLWASRIVARVAKPYIVAAGAIPIFALAPIIIVWFGIGIVSKIALAFIATFVVAVGQAYQGAVTVDAKYLRLMQVFGATKMQTFRTVVVPNSLIWVINAMKLNIGLALLGAFIGEFISAEQGLGKMIVRASGTYDMATVYVGVVALVVISLLLTSLVDLLERRLLRWKQ